MHVCGAIHCSMGNLPIVTSSKKNESPSSRSYKLPIIPPVNDGTSPSMFKFKLPWPFEGKHSCCEFVSVVAMSHLKDSISYNSSPALIFSLQHSLSLSVCICVCGVGTFMRTQVFLVCLFYSQNIDQLCVSALITTHCKKKLVCPRLGAAQVLC